MQVKAPMSGYITEPTPPGAEFPLKWMQDKGGPTEGFFFVLVGIR